MQITYPHFSTDFEYGFDCGTGVGMTAICPRESFRIEKTYKELLENYDYTYDHFKEEDSLGIITNDLYHQKPLIELVEHEFKILENASVKRQDSVDVRFYIPVFSPIKGDLYYIKSNTIKFSYFDIIEHMRAIQTERAKYY